VHSAESLVHVKQGLVHKLLPIKVDPTLGDFEASLFDVSLLQQSLFEEERNPYEAAMASLACADVAPEERFVVHVAASTAYSQTLLHLLHTALVPSLTAMHGLRFFAEQRRSRLLERLKAATLVRSCFLDFGTYTVNGSC
jgi:hypothetical protein